MDILLAAIVGVIACVFGLSTGYARGRKTALTEVHRSRSIASTKAAATKARRKQEARLAQTAARVGLGAWNSENDANGETVPTESEGRE